MIGEGELEVVGKEEKKEGGKQITANKQKVAAFRSPNKGSAGCFSQLRMPSALRRLAELNVTPPFAFLHP